MPLISDAVIEGRKRVSPAASSLALSHPDHVWFYEYWLKRRPLEGVPRRQDIDPTDFPRLLPRIAVIGAEAAGKAGRLQYRYRLAGTEIVTRSGRDPTGKTFEELYDGDYLKRATALYDRLRKGAEPHFSEHVYPVDNGDGFFKYDRLILPLATDRGKVDQFLMLIVVVEQVGSFHRQGSFPRAGKAKPF